MTFDTGTFANACKPGAKPRERVEDDMPVTDTITEKVNRAERLAKEKEREQLRQKASEMAAHKGLEVETIGVRVYLPAELCLALFSFLKMHLL